MNSLARSPIAIGAYNSQIGGSIGGGPITITGTISGQMSPLPVAYVPNDFERIKGEKVYEMKNHLGNVLLVTTDMKLGQEIGTPDDTTDFYLPEVVAANDYYPFGMPMVGRTWQAGTYRYGFNGQESDGEWNGEGNSYDFGARVYDGRLGRWMSVDPYASKYQDHAPYSFCINIPMLHVDVGGDTIKYASGTDKLRGRIMNLRRESTAFDALYRLVDDLPHNVEVKNDPETLQRIGARGAATTDGKSIRLGDEISNTYALSEEFFHIYQMSLYGSKRRSHEMEAEAKVFNYVVIAEIGEHLDQPPLSESSLYDESEMTAKTLNESSFLIYDKNQEASYWYISYLKSFEELALLGSQRYSGSQRMLIPIAYNKVMVRRALNINSQSITRNKEIDDEIKPASSGYQITPSPMTKKLILLTSIIILTNVQFLRGQSVPIYSEEELAGFIMSRSNIALSYSTMDFPKKFSKYIKNETPNRTMIANPGEYYLPSSKVVRGQPMFRLTFWGELLDTLAFVLVDYKYGQSCDFYINYKEKPTWIGGFLFSRRIQSLLELQTEISLKNYQFIRKRR